MDFALVAFGLGVGLILLFRLSPRRVVATDVFHAAILIGSVPGVWVGSHWSVRVEPAVLPTTLAVVLIGAGLALLIKAGLDIPVAVIVPFPLGVIALLVVTVVRSRKARAEVGA